MDQEALKDTLELLKFAARHVPRGEPVADGLHPARRLTEEDGVWCGRGIEDRRARDGKRCDALISSVGRAGATGVCRIFSGMPASGFRAKSQSMIRSIRIGS
jgi:hypothetical protein